MLIQKQIGGFVGYGFNDEEALSNCISLSLLNDIRNIYKGDGLIELRESLAPWSPRENTLHLNKVGYMKVIGTSLFIGDDEYIITKDLFEVLYKALFKHLSIIELCLCSYEIFSMFKSCGINYPNLNTYTQVIPEDIGDYTNVKYVYFSGEYTIINHKENKISIKRSNEEMFWSCIYDSNIHSIKDILWYISYVRGYAGVENIIKCGDRIG